MQNLMAAVLIAFGLGAAEVLQASEQYEAENKLYSAIESSSRFPAVLTNLTMQYLKKPSNLALAKEFIIPTSRVRRASLSPNKTRLVVYGEDEGGTYVMDTEGQLLFSNPDDRFVAWNPQGNMVTVAKTSDDYSYARYEVRTWDATTGKYLGSLLTWGRKISSLAFHPSGKKVVYTIVGDGEGYFNIWQLHATNQITVDCPRNPHSVSWSSSGDKLIVHFALDGFNIYNSNGNLLHRYDQWHARAAWSPIENNIVAVKRDYTDVIEIWDTNSSEQNMTLDKWTKTLPAKSYYGCITWSPSGKEIVSEQHKKIFVADIMSGNWVESVGSTIGNINDELTEIIYTNDILILLGGKDRQITRSISTIDLHGQIFRRFPSYDIAEENTLPSKKRKSPCLIKGVA